MEKCKILIVEDELIVRQAIKYIIENHKNKYELIAEANNGQEACVMIEKNKPHVIICDIVMPIMDGLDFSKYIHMKYPEIFVIILSGHTDFEYVQQCYKNGIFEYLLKPKLNPKNLCEVLDKICKKIGIFALEEKEEQDFWQLAFQNQEGAEKFCTQEKYKDKYFGVLGFNLTKILGYKKSRCDVYFEILSDKLHDFYENQIVECFMEQDHIVLILIAFHEKTNQDFEENILFLAKSIADEMLGLKVVYSTIETNHEIVLEKIRQTRETAKQQFFISNQVYAYQTRETIYKKPDLYTQFRHTNERFEEVFLLLKECLKEMRYEDGYREDELKKQIEHIIYSVFNDLFEKEMITTEEKFNQIQIMYIISTIHSLEDLLGLVEEIYIDIQNDMQNIKAGTNAFIQQILDYIEHNFKEQLTLQKVAEEFHISYSYLSTYFSHNLGIGFSEYLNKIRIEYAKEMLLTSDISISEICTQAGYLDQSYFSRVFKKHMGMSPTVYRRVKK